MSILYEDKTALLRRCFFDVQNEVGLGWQERPYHHACELWFREHDIPYESSPAHHLRLHGGIAHTLFPDLVVWDLITVELKAISRKCRDSEFVQLFDYLKCRNDRVGLLVNMGLDRVAIHRVLHDVPQHYLEENWQYWDGCITGKERDVGMAIRQGLLEIYKAHGTGYGIETTRNLLIFELRHLGMRVVRLPVEKAFYHGVVVDESSLDCLVVEGSLVVTFSALFENNDFNIHKGKSYLRALNLKWGVAANFGKKVAQFTGLRLNE